MGTAAAPAGVRDPAGGPELRGRRAAGTRIDSSVVAGWCPVDTQSGQYRDAHPRLSRAGNRFVRRVVWMLAVGAVRHPDPYRDYFLRRTVAGKNKMDSLVAIGRKLLTTIYAILKTGRPYDPAYVPHRPCAGAAVA